MKKVLAVLVLILILTPFFAGCAPKAKPLNVIVMFHNHQPFYKDPESNTYILPWVRLHGAKDYYRMPYLSSQFKDIHITYDLSGSLIDQIKDYLSGVEDKYHIVSRVDPDKLTIDQKFFMLSIPGGFFDINWDHIIKKVPLYTDLLNKRQDIFKQYSIEDKDKLVNAYSSQDYLNLQTLFNLFWLDVNYIKSDPELAPLLDKAYKKENFTIEERNLVLRKQMEIMSMILPEYKKLMDEKLIEIVSTPFAHPISPLLVDFGLSTELKEQLDASNKLFNETFGSTPAGIWASECALNDDVLKIFSEFNLKWTISDIDNLPQLGIDKNDPIKAHLPYTINGVTVFFRDKYLSDGISFRYSGKSVNEAITDVETTLTNLQKLNTAGDLVYTIALDGENAWEYYENDGNDFLNAFYGKLSELQKKGIIKVVTPSEYLSKFKGHEVTLHKVSALYLENKDISNINSYSNLPKREYDGYFGESSWVNPTLDTWIGEPQENIAWMWLIDAYKKYKEKENSLSLSIQTEVRRDLMIAEGSDWFWWYGSDQSSGNDPAFDRLYKIHLGEIYKKIGSDIPDYLYGNYFPDGEPYVSTEISLKDDEVVSVSNLSNMKIGEMVYSKKKNLLTLKLNSQDFIVAVYNGKSLNSFLSEQTKPRNFNMSNFPYTNESIGMPVDFEIYGKDSVYSLDLNGLNLNKLYIVIVGVKNGNIKVETQPIKLKFPLNIGGTLIGELYDQANDDSGPGTYTYPLNDVFKNKGHLFDLISFKMYDAGENYILQYEMGSIGGNPWNGPNGFSFQIIETYFDVIDGGMTEPIDVNGPNALLDDKHPWDVAIRIAGWSYGNYIQNSKGEVAQGELGISVDNEKNTINVVVPKKYLSINSNYTPYVCIISGSQDGYGAGYFRAITQTASEWTCGGGDPEALNAGVLPKVMDIFTPKDKTQKEILTSYDVNSKKLAIIPMLPLEKAKEVPNLISSYKLNIGEITPPNSEFSLDIQIKNIGKGDQDDLEGNELTLYIPDFVKVRKIETSSFKSVINGKVIAFNGSVKKGEVEKVKITFGLASNVPNAYKENFKGILSFNGDGLGKNSTSSAFEFYFYTSYKLEICLPFDKNYLVRNGSNIQFKNANIKTEFSERFNDATTSLEDLCNALGISYSFDGNKLTLVFMDNKYEHWVGQNKALLNGSAIPLVQGEQNIRSYVENGILKFPIKALAYAFKFKYNIDSVNKTANLYYLP
ncbi:glucodextranase DOMON-like domain-containing protein [Caldisericum exile]|uniref:Amylopullulanase n=1 Tax=Caldisericum exile (strain DSM 21853 / NBRC 104410 / AZM16c01) TaxID=511051 RepID=A0A7U6GEE7_CALEA|nr:glucodextranase DOMON-like domain-containing protein [Caldisericum exile]BAL80864.1 amylopullulanase [Caldisericum exile AZM16c01]